MEKTETAGEQPVVILLDVYETLLDMAEVQRRVNTMLDSKRAYTIWFALFMQYCFANNAVDDFHDFESIGRATLQMTGYKLGRTLSESDANDVLEMLKYLPVHEEVPEVLSTLSNHGFSLAALTNSPGKFVYERMEKTGLISYFEEVLSAETVRKYKPEKMVYEWAAQKLGMSAGSIMLVSAHEWDIAGGSNAGMKTAFLQRSLPLHLLMSPPDLTCKNLADFAAQVGKSKAGEER